MKNIDVLAKALKNLQNDSGLIRDLADTQRKIAESVRNDAQSLAPGSTYPSSIKLSPTEITKKNVSTQIFTDVTVESKAGKVYNLGFLLETGTKPHDIPNAFGFGEKFGIGGRFDGKFHPGFVAMPHFKPALNKNKWKCQVKYKQQLKDNSEKRPENL